MNEREKELKKLKKLGKNGFSLIKLLDHINIVLMIYLYYQLLFVKHDISSSMFVAAIIFIVSIPFAFRVAYKCWLILNCWSSISLMIYDCKWYHKLAKKLMKTSFVPSEKRIKQLKEMHENTKESRRMFGDDNNIPDLPDKHGRPIPKCDCGNCYWCLERQEIERLNKAESKSDERDSMVFRN